MDKKRTFSYRDVCNRARVRTNCASAYRATVAKRRKCRSSWPELARTNRSRWRCTVNPFAESSRSIVSGTFRNTSLKVVPAQVERYIFSANNKQKFTFRCEFSSSANLLVLVPYLTHRYYLFSFLFVNENYSHRKHARNTCFAFLLFRFHQF